MKRSLKKLKFNTGVLRAKYFFKESMSLSLVDLNVGDVYNTHQCYHVLFIHLMSVTHAQGSNVD